MLTLRPHQTRIVREINGALHTHRSCIMTAPCGIGKRYIGVWYCMQIAGRGKRVLVVTDRRILVTQFADECRNSGVDYGLIMGNEPTRRDAPIQIASVATLKRREWKDLPEADWVIIDECHKEDSAYSTMMALYPTAKFLGLTATPVGAEGKALVPTPWECLIEPVRNSDMIQQGWLLPTHMVTPSEPDVQGVTISSRREYNQQQLGDRVEQCTVFADVFDWWAPWSDVPTICFAPRVKYARGLAEQFKSRGYPAEVIEAATSKRDRHECFDRFESGETRVLVSVDVLREGFDAPHAGCGIDLQPNAQLRTYWQKAGRVKRPHHTKDQAVWLDFAGNFWRHLHPDEDPDWQDVTGNCTTADMVRKKKPSEPGEPKQWSCPNCSYVLAPWQRLHGGVCPNCGHQSTKPIRKIRMADGRLKTISAQESKKIKRSKASEQQKAWDKWRYIAHHRGKPLSFARAMYRKQTGEWPSNLKCCPESYDSMDWDLKPADVYPWMER
jgi:superfamily II DNA or RNA helicase